jgi:hypothetical protein
MTVGKTSLVIHIETNAKKRRTYRLDVCIEFQWLEKICVEFHHDLGFPDLDLLINSQPLYR